MGESDLQKVMVEAGIETKRPLRAEDFNRATYPESDTVDMDEGDLLVAAEAWLGDYRYPERRVKWERSLEYYVKAQTPGPSLFIADDSGAEAQNRGQNPRRGRCDQGGYEATEGRLTMRISLFFRWYDLWIGAYWDAQKRTLYLCPLPMVGVRVTLRHRCDKQGHQWVADGGRPCPRGSQECSQPVYVCSVCGDYDYGNPGGPAAQECAACDYEPEAVPEHHETVNQTRSRSVLKPLLGSGSRHGCPAGGEHAFPYRVQNDPTMEMK
jgi:hypothetical protein